MKTRNRKTNRNFRNRKTNRNKLKNRKGGNIFDWFNFNKMEPKIMI
jgi:hypothetical protein